MLNAGGYVCCPHRTSLLFRECKMLFVAPAGCRSERARCSLLPPQDVVIQRIQNAFCLPLARYFLLPPHDAIVINKMLLICYPHRMSFRECKTFRPVATSLVWLMTVANSSTSLWASWNLWLNMSVSMVVCPSQSWQNPATGWSLWTRTWGEYRQPLKAYLKRYQLHHNSSLIVCVCMHACICVFVCLSIGVFTCHACLYGVFYFIFFHYLSYLWLSYLDCINKLVFLSFQVLGFRLISWA